MFKAGLRLNPVLKGKFRFIIFVYNLMINALKRIEKIIRKNAFEQKKKKPGLKFNPGLTLIGPGGTSNFKLHI